MLHSLERRLRRLARKQAKQVETISVQAEEQLERNFVRRFGRLVPVRRFVATWLLVPLLLIGCVVAQTRGLSGYYQTLQPVAGGIYREGIVGSFTNASPLYATGQTNNAVSKLLFASLFKYDEQNHLIGDLAESISVNKDGTQYIVHLRPNLTWHDGQPLTAADVAFTYRIIQNPDVDSPLSVSWQRVTVTASDSRTVVFALPNPLASFPDSLTTGIVPEHILKDIPAAELRSSSFNTTRPVGAGPFKLKDIEVTGSAPADREENIVLEPFEEYHGDEPKLASFVVHTFPNEDRMVRSFQNQDITAMAGLTQLPAKLAETSGVQTYRMPLTAANMVFFRMSEGVLNDKAVRQALVGAADTQKIINKVDSNLLPVREPFLQGQLGYDPKLTQLQFGKEQAVKTLEKAGWKLQENGMRIKKGTPLTFKLYAQNTSEYSTVTRELQRQWRELGVDMQVYLQNSQELQSTVAYRNYDALLYGISMGIDPDVYVYWDSVQADARSSSQLNFSEYKSDQADIALEAGRTRTGDALRAVKYQPFLKAWREDAPALGLYQPQFIYVTHGQVYNLRDQTLTTGTDRFNNVADWMLRTARKDTISR